jgi:hypothetical protein
MKESPFEIDSGNLEQEWIEQPLLRKEYGEQLADSKRNYSHAKAAFELTESEVLLDIRRDPEKFGFETKPTEATASAAVVADKRYQKAYGKMIDAKHEQDLLEAAVSAAEHKKYALQDLVHLHLSEFHAKPRISGDNNRRMQEMEENTAARRASEKMKESRRRRSDEE